MIFEHESVLLNESIKQLNINIDGIYVDGTLGGGGHCKEILRRLSNDGRIIAIDQDIEAIGYCKFKFEKIYKNITFVHDNFSNIKNILSELNIDSIDGMILDLGVSSHQLDVAKRGFSYMKNSYLDMRMDSRNKISAYDVVNTYDEKKLYKVIKEYGEERWAKRIVSFIILERKKEAIETTFDLVNVIKKAIPKKFRYEGIHPARRVFQAIRIEVNDELSILKNTINDVVDKLKSKGRLCVITFHSLEDRIIKNIFKDLEYPCKCPKEFPICICGKIPKVKIITKKPLVSTEEEVEKNHRCRSAKLRVIEKL